MRLLKSDKGDFSQLKISARDSVYNTLASGAEEVTFIDVIEGIGKNKAGFDKLRSCGGRTKCDGLRSLAPSRNSALEECGSQDLPKLSRSKSSFSLYDLTK